MSQSSETFCHIKQLKNEFDNVYGEVYTGEGSLNLRLKIHELVTNLPGSSICCV